MNHVCGAAVRGSESSLEMYLRMSPDDDSSVAILFAFWRVMWINKATICALASGLHYVMTEKNFVQ
jgi:hypothetical protein